MKLRYVRRKPFILYHWSPTSRRKQIQRDGLVIGSPVAIHSTGWSPPYLCFANSPSLAWGLSAGMRHAPAGDWDLWMVWSTDTEALHVRDDHAGKRVAEYRTRHGVAVTSLWRVGSRNNQK